MFSLLANLDSLPGQKQSEDALSNLVSQGTLGSTCALLIVALFFAVKSIMKAKDDRFQDQKAMTEVLGKSNEAARELAIEMNRASSNLVIESTRHLDAVRNTLLAQEKSLDDLSEAIDALREENTNLRVMAQNFKCSRGPA